MKKIKSIVLVVVVLSLGTVSGMKAYSGLVKSTGLIQSNIESLTSGDPFGDLFQGIKKGYYLGDYTSNDVTVPCCLIGDEDDTCNAEEVDCIQTYKAR